MTLNTKDLLRTIREDNDEDSEIEEESVVNNDIVVLDKAEEEMLQEYAGDSLFRFIKTPIARSKNFELTKDQVIRLKKHVANLKTGTYALVPLICSGVPVCPLGSICPFVEVKEDGELDISASNFPLLQQCPVETVTMQAKIIELCREYKVNPQDVTDVAIITKIAELDIYDHRLSMTLASEDAQSLMVDSVTQVDQKTGAVFSELKMHPALDAKEKLARQRDSLVRSMLGTRSEKARIRGNKDNENDYAQKTSELMTLLKKIQEGEIIDGNYEEVSAKVKDV